MQNHNSSSFSLTELEEVIMEAIQKVLNHRTPSNTSNTSRHDDEYSCLTSSKTSQKKKVVFRESAKQRQSEIDREIQNYLGDLFLEKLHIILSDNSENSTSMGTNVSSRSSKSSQRRIPKSRRLIKEEIFSNLASAFEFKYDMENEELDLVKKVRTSTVTEDVSDAVPNLAAYSPCSELTQPEDVCSSGSLFRQKKKNSKHKKSEKAPPVEQSTQESLASEPSAVSELEEATSSKPGLTNVFSRKMFTVPNLGSNKSESDDALQAREDSVICSEVNIMADSRTSLPTGGINADVELDNLVSKDESVRMSQTMPQPPSVYSSEKVDIIANSRNSLLTGDINGDAELVNLVSKEDVESVRMSKTMVQLQSVHSSESEKIEANIMADSQTSLPTGGMNADAELVNLVSKEESVRISQTMVQLQSVHSLEGGNDPDTELFNDVSNKDNKSALVSTAMAQPQSLNGSENETPESEKRLAKTTENNEIKESALSKATFLSTSKVNNIPVSPDGVTGTGSQTSYTNVTPESSPQPLPSPRTRLRASVESVLNEILTDDSLYQVISSLRKSQISARYLNLKKKLQNESSLKSDVSNKSQRRKVVERLTELMVQQDGVSPLPSTPIGDNGETQECPQCQIVLPTSLFQKKCEMLHCPLKVDKCDKLFHSEIDLMMHFSWIHHDIFIKEFQWCGCCHKPYHQTEFQHGHF